MNIEEIEKVKRNYNIQTFSFAVSDAMISQAPKIIDQIKAELIDRRKKLPGRDL